MQTSAHLRTGLTRPLQAQITHQRLRHKSLLRAEGDSYQARPPVGMIQRCWGPWLHRQSLLVSSEGYLKAAKHHLGFACTTWQMGPLGALVQRNLQAMHASHPARFQLACCAAES